MKSYSEFISEGLFNRKPAPGQEHVKHIKNMSDDELLKVAKAGGNTNHKSSDPLFDVLDMMPEISKRAKKNKAFLTKVIAANIKSVNNYFDHTGKAPGKGLVKFAKPHKKGLFNK